MTATTMTTIGWPLQVEIKILEERKTLALGEMKFI